MTGVNNGECQNIINQVKHILKTMLMKKKLTLLEAFAQRYFSSSSVEDLKSALH